MSSSGAGLTALVVDDELPALSDLGYLLGRDDRIGEVITASSGTEALQVLDARDVDVVFSDISMPGLDGMALARVISRFRVRPQIVFVTAHDEHAVDAFALAATDYVMKPVRAERLSEAIRRVVVAQSEKGNGMPSAPGEPAAPVVEDETIPVELGGVTRFITRSRIRYAQAHGDYARLHTDTGSHLVRVPLSVLEERWAEPRLRPDPPQHARRPAPRQRGADGPRAVLGRRRQRRAAGEPAAHQGAARHPPAPADRRPAPERRLSGDHPGGRPAPAGAGHELAAGAAPMRSRPVSRDLDEQTGLGDVYLDGLMRAQLRLSVAVLALTVVGLAALPVVLTLVPATRSLTVLGLPFPWLVLGITVYPAAWFLARWYTRQAERIEQDFAEVVEPS